MKIITILGFCLAQITFSPSAAISAQVDLSSNSVQSVSGKNNALIENIILTWKGNPATSQAVTWRTSSSLPESYAEIALANASPDFTKTARKYPARTTKINVNKHYVYYHSVNFEDLLPDTMYAYRVGSGKIWSEWFHFRTASKHTQPFKFIFFGDAQNKVFSLWSRVIRAAYTYAADARFMVHAGDLVNSTNSLQEWDEWFDAGSWIFAMVPSILTPGNHEYKIGFKGIHTLSKYWKPQFTLPENGINSLSETVYYIDYQGVRIISLNSNKKVEKQTKWLETVLKSNKNTWTIVVFHHPIFASSKRRDNLTIRRLWKPVFDKFQVDLVLQGHDHLYTRARVCGSDESGAKTRNCTVYVTSISGMKMYRATPKFQMDRIGENMQLFQVISFAENTMHYEAVTVTGEIYDSFRVIINKDGTKQFVKQLPAEILGELSYPHN